MKRRVVTLLSILLVAMVLFSIQAQAASGSVEEEIRKVVHYAQEYETGNIKYVELLLYESASRQNLNEILGVVSREEGGLLKEEQIRPVLGDPTEETKWVWSEKDESEKILQEAIPAWNKIIFDGKQIQIRLEAWPSLYIKNGKEEIIYRLHFSTDFKKPKENFNIQEEIEKIKGLAEAFGSSPTNDKAEALAKASVSAERLFESFYRQSGEKCDNLMSGILGSENKRKDEKLFVQEIDFYQGKNFIVNGRLEMCDQCDWPWINLNFWIDGRGSGFRNLEGGRSNGDIRRGESDNYYKERISSLIDEFKESLSAEDYDSASSLQAEVRELTNAWSEASNNIREEIDAQFRDEIEKQSGKHGEDQEEYWWIKLEQQKRKLEKEMMEKNYQARKEFYLSLFKDYKTKESYYEQREYEKRLVELFTTSKKEMCDNNQDDNADGKIDCGDSQCGGKVCGKQKISVQDGNSTSESYLDLYCIAGTCQMKEDLKENKTVCGNNICEAGESESCAQDCSLCPTYDAIDCSGKIIFSGVNTTTGCNLEPICISQNSSCQIDSDCVQPLCGTASCVQNQCKVAALTECRESECVDGAKKYNQCSSGEKLVSALCDAGKWVEIDTNCSLTDIVLVNETDGLDSIPIPDNASEGNHEDEADKIIGDECSVKEDCGNANDVCSNGRCITLPQTIGDMPAEQGEREQDEQVREEPEVTEENLQSGQENSLDAQDDSASKEENSESESPDSQDPEPVISGSFIFNLVRLSLARIGLTGFNVEGEESYSESSSESDSQDQESSSSPDNSGSGSQEDSNQQPDAEDSNSESQQEEEQANQDEGDNQKTEDEREDDREREEDERERRERDNREREQREKEDRERRELECKDNCNRNCYDSKIRPCTEKCIWDTCGYENLDECNIEEAKETCEASCNEKEDIGSCVSSCNDNCLSGKEQNVMFEAREEEHKEELGVFKAGGMCRKDGAKTESFIYFDGWGEPFQNLQKIKHKYYENNQGDWCKHRLESLKKERKQFESGFNEEFVTWFFEQYLANSADDWEGHISGIFELYWRDVDNAREMAMQMDCLGQYTLTESDYDLVSVSYKTDYGKIEFWEEINKVKLPGMQKEVEIITPYMKTWVFPSRDFLAYEMKKSMENHEFPGPAEEKAERENEEGPTEEEKKMIKKDKKFMNKISKLAEKYGGSVDVSLQLKDKKKDEVVFNIYAKIDEENIIKMEPMPPSEMPEQDMRIEIDFDKVYDLIYSSEKEMQGERIESPPWSRKSQPVQKIKEAVNGIKMWFKVKSMLNSADYSPSESKSDAKTLLNEFMSKMMEGGDDRGKGKDRDMKEEKDNQDGKNLWDSKEKITGEVVGN